MRAVISASTVRRMPAASTASRSLTTRTATSAIVTSSTLGCKANVSIAEPAKRSMTEATLQAVVTESYIVVCVSENKKIVENCFSYLKTMLFRLLCQITIVSPDVSQRTFTLVPLQDFSKPWTDEELYKKYGLTDEEIQFIESMIRPME